MLTELKTKHIFVDKLVAEVCLTNIASTLALCYVLCARFFLATTH
jgi:hypothetical protein